MDNNKLRSNSSAATFRKALDEKYVSRELVNQQNEAAAVFAQAHFVDKEIVAEDKKKHDEEVAKLQVELKAEKEGRMSDRFLAQSVS